MFHLIRGPLKERYVQELPFDGSKNNRSESQDRSKGAVLFLVMIEMQKERSGEHLGKSFKVLKQRESF